MNELLLTPEGLSRLQDELERLVTVDRDAVRTRLRDAVETDGDLAGNGDYLDAKEEQALLEQRIGLLKGRLARARLIDPPGGPDDVVTLGSRVRLRALETDDTVEYQIVDSIECDPSVFQNFARISSRKSRARTHTRREDYGRGAGWHAGIRDPRCRGVALAKPSPREYRNAHEASSSTWREG